MWALWITGIFWSFYVSLWIRLFVIIVNLKESKINLFNYCFIFMYIGCYGYSVQLLDFNKHLHDLLVYYNLSWERWFWKFSLKRFLLKNVHVKLIIYLALRSKISRFLPRLKAEHTWIGKWNCHRFLICSMKFVLILWNILC